MPEIFDLQTSTLLLIGEVMIQSDACSGVTSGSAGVLGLKLGL